jgi:hypothetical protein
MKVRIPSLAMIVAILALLLALSGTAVAGALITGAQIKNNTVASVDLTNNSIKSVDVRNNALTTLDVQNGSLRAVDFAAGELETGPAGPAGPAGPTGPAGPSGPQGAPGLAGLEIVFADSPSNSDFVRQVEASCPAGKKAVGGGAHIWQAAGLVALDESYPSNATTWRATAYEVNATALNWHLRAYVVCATVAA